jgi:hypothetical protein
MEKSPKVTNYLPGLQSKHLLTAPRTTYIPNQRESKRNWDLKKTYLKYSINVKILALLSVP